MPDLSTNTPTIEQANGEILLWQSRIRLGFALLLASIGTALLASDVVQRISPSIIAVVFAYVLVTVLLTVLVRRTGEATQGIVLAVVASDILFVFAVAAVATPPEYYGRSLLLGFAIVHLSEFYFGRRIAWGTLAAIVLGYLGLIRDVTGPGRMLGWPQEIASLAVFVLAASTFIISYGSFKDRLHRISMLFEHAQEGDFSEEFDVSRETRPDAVTMVGRAYNGVRSQLANLVLTDPLSGCLNRRGLEQQLKRELARAARSGKDVALLALDVDYFKDINDSWDTGQATPSSRRSGRSCARLRAAATASPAPAVTSSRSCSPKRQPREPSASRRAFGKRSVSIDSRACRSSPCR